MTIIGKLAGLVRYVEHRIRRTPVTATSNKLGASVRKTVAEKTQRNGVTKRSSDSTIISHCVGTPSEGENQ